MSNAPHRAILLVRLPPRLPQHRLELVPKPHFEVAQLGMVVAVALEPPPGYQLLVVEGRLASDRPPALEGRGGHARRVWTAMSTGLDRGGLSAGENRGYPMERSDGADKVRLGLAQMWSQGWKREVLKGRA